MVQQTLPADDDYLVLKPRHSVFYGTPLDVLLEELGAKSIMFAGLSTNSCILLSVSDAYVRDYGLWVPSDCVAGKSEQEHSATLRLMETNFKVDTTPSDQLDLHAIASKCRKDSTG
jgi:nicotinamidase-related amidase